jgi:hypothetical protein
MRKRTEMMKESGGKGLWFLRSREKCEASGSSGKYPIDGHGRRKRRN